MSYRPLLIEAHARLRRPRASARQLPREFERWRVAEIDARPCIFADVLPSESAYFNGVVLSTRPSPIFLPLASSVGSTLRHAATIVFEVHGQRNPTVGAGSLETTR
jgi:hypothetical protein